MQITKMKSSLVVLIFCCCWISMFQGASGSGLTSNLDSSPKKKSPKEMRDNWRFARRFSLKRLRNKYSFKENKSKLVDAIVIGAQKAGSTALQRTLQNYPLVAMPNRELHFFDHNDAFAKGVAWYHGQFPREPAGFKDLNVKDRSNGFIHAEKTPNYMPDKTAMKRIHEYNPNVKLIVTLRDPVTRIFSMYNHMLMEATIPSKGSPPDFLEHCKRVAAFGSFDAFLIAMGRNSTEIFYGMYADQLEYIFSLFDKSQMYIQISERPHDMGKLLDFLGLGKTHVSPPQEFHAHKRSYSEKMSQEANCTLASLYDRQNKKLFEILGYDIPEWTSAQALKDICFGKKNLLPGV